MTQAIFRLESFTAALAGRDAKQIFDRDALDRAHAEGLAAGLARSHDDQMRHLGAGLERLAVALAEDAQRRAALRAEAVAALSPILDAILDNLAPAADSARLRDALTAELERLAQKAAPLRARIACSDRLKGLVQQCLADAGIEGIELEPSDMDRISLSLEGGRIEFCPDRLGRDMRALISEITGDESSWTH